MNDSHVSVIVAENRDGAQYYIVASGPYSILARYREINSLHTQIGHKIEAQFPGKTVLKKNDPKRVEERRSLLQKWFQEAIFREEPAVIAFFEEQVRKYGYQGTKKSPTSPRGGPTSPRKATSPVERTAASDSGIPRVPSYSNLALPGPPYTYDVMEHPASLYACSNGDLRVYNHTSQNWPKLASSIWPAWQRIDERAVYAERCFIFTDAEYLKLFYIPWGTPMAICDMGQHFGFAVTKPLIAYSEGFVWIVANNASTEGRVLGCFEMKTGTWRKADNPNLPSFALKEQVRLVIAGDNIHFLGYSHFVYNISMRTWIKLTAPPFTHDQTVVRTFRSAVAREFIIHAAGHHLLRYNLLTHSWHAMPVLPSLSPVCHILWDQRHHVYFWTGTGAFCFDLKKDDWIAKENLSLDNITIVFNTYDFDEDKELDQELEGLIMTKYLMKDVGPWNKMYAEDAISEDAKNVLVMYDTLTSTERIQFFKKNKENLVEIFKQSAKGPGAVRIKNFVFELLRADVGLTEECFPEFVREQFFKIQRKSDKSIFYVPNSTSYQGNSSVLIAQATATLPTPCYHTAGLTISGVGVTISGAVTINGVQVTYDAHGNLVPVALTPSPVSPRNSITFASPSSPQQGGNSRPTSPLILTEPPDFPLYQGPVDYLSQVEVQRRNFVIRALRDRNIEFSDYLICPITQHIMFDPVFTMDGHTYEKVAIQQWFAQGNNTSPLTNKPLPSYDILPAFTVKNLIIELFEKLGLHFVD